MSRRIFAQEPEPDPELEKLLKETRAADLPASLSLPRSNAGPDIEVWVRDRVQTAIRMALALQNELGCRADKSTLDGGLFGIADGATTEILVICGFSNNFVNLRTPRP